MARKAFTMTVFDSQTWSPSSTPTRVSSRLKIGHGEQRFTKVIADQLLFHGHEEHQAFQLKEDSARISVSLSEFTENSLQLVGSLAVLRFHQRI